MIKRSKHQQTQGTQIYLLKLNHNLNILEYASLCLLATKKICSNVQLEFQKLPPLEYF